MKQLHERGFEAAPRSRSGDSRRDVDAIIAAVRANVDRLLTDGRSDVQWWQEQLG